MLNIICSACKATDGFVEGGGYPYVSAKDLKTANKTIAEQNRVITLLEEKLKEVGYEVTFGK